MPEQETICLKRLSLITPEYAQKLGIKTDKPIFTDFADSGYYIYHGGEILEAPVFLPGSMQIKEKIAEGEAALHSQPVGGFGYFEESSWEMSEESHYRWTRDNNANWVAVIEPLGKVVKHDDYFMAFNSITDKLKVLEIRAFCEGCHNGPLPMGRVLDVYRNGYLFAACNQKISRGHDKKFPGFRFNMADGKVNFEGIEEWQRFRRRN